MGKGDICRNFKPYLEAPTPPFYDAGPQIPLSLTQIPIFYIVISWL
jgi:hypothetical protein